MTDLEKFEKLFSEVKAEIINKEKFGEGVQITIEGRAGRLSSYVGVIFDKNGKYLELTVRY